MASPLDSGKLSRRHIMRNAAYGLGGVALAGPLGLLAERKAYGSARATASPFGPIAPALDTETGLPLLQLPPGFKYRSMGWTGDIMHDGAPTPPRHDGMAVVQVTAGRSETFALVRNHENGVGPLVGTNDTPVYDDFSLPGAGIPALGGGTTSLLIRNTRLVDSRGSLGGTLTNCAGGPTPWNSWITCEEGVINGAPIGALVHGWCYEVPSPLIGTSTAQPITDMGLMAHEAVAVDPRTSYVYETEDNSNFSGFYRYVPNTPGVLANGGILQMLRVVGEANADLRFVEQGDSFDTEWVDIADPAQLPANAVSPGDGLPPIAFEGPSGPYAQGFDNGGATFRRLEGAWYHKGVIYFTDTSGGPTGNGVVWAFQPEASTNTATGRLTAIFVSTDGNEADNPDNVTVSPTGQVFFCEDNGRAEGTRLIGVREDGSSFEFCRNNMNLTEAVPGRPGIEPADYRPSEFAGATFDPSGRRLFVNIQTPGVTFVIVGPFNDFR